jgi:hypothetical protein
MLTENVGRMLIVVVYRGLITNQADATAAKQRGRIFK